MNARTRGTVIKIKSDKCKSDKMKLFHIVCHQTRTSLPLDFVKDKHLANFKYGYIFQESPELSTQLLEGKKKNLLWKGY